MGTAGGGPREGTVYKQNRQPYTIGAPMAVPEGFVVHEENIVNWMRDGEFYMGHELILTTPAGTQRSFMSLLEWGDIGAARLLSYRTLASTQREPGAH